jgi:hypothetical protein
MGYEQNKCDESLLWRNYMNNVGSDEQWLKEIKTLNLPVSSKSYGTYSEKEFEKMLVSDIQFKEKWGTIRK